MISVVFFFSVTAASVIYTLSLHDALPISASPPPGSGLVGAWGFPEGAGTTTADASGIGNTATLERSEEHTSELQSLTNLVCRLLLEKKKWARRWTLSTGAPCRRPRLRQPW